MSQKHIRNFAIIAHIDHGKSTLADRLLETTKTVAHRNMQAQLLDSNPIERERGITIKLAPVRMKFNPQFTIHNIKHGNKNSSTLDIGNWDLGFSDSEYILNLIDTPGHVDFSYEVSRSLAACEGAILVVDATQGIQAQTLAHLHTARKNNLTIIPVINKIDLPNARVEETSRELEALGFPPLSPDPSGPSLPPNPSPLLISAKTGQGIPELLGAIITRIPPPSGDPDAPPRALVFSSQYDTHRGVIVFVRVVDGSLPLRVGNAQSQLKFLASGATVTPVEIGYFQPSQVPADGLQCGEVGYIATGLKDVRMAKVGDTITVDGSWFRVHGKSENTMSSSTHHPLPTTNHQPPTTHPPQPLPGYQEPKSMVFVSLFPISQDEFVTSREAMEKLRLSDSAFTFRPIHSAALGNGFHCGFLGLLHAEVVQERLLREFGLTMIATAPSVEYKLTLMPGVDAGKIGLKQSQQLTSHGIEKKDREFVIQSAAEYPNPSFVENTKEPIMQLTIFVPRRYVGPVMQLTQEKRAEYVDLKYLGDQAEFCYLIPLSEMIVDFFDRLKSVTEGYASLDYEFFDYQSVDLVKVDILLNKEPVDALSYLVIRDQAEYRSRQIVERLSEVIPRQQFEIPVQAAIGGRVIARSDIKAFRKDVIQKLYGGDRTRKDKLLKKQAKGKAKMKMIGRVEIPQSAFFEVLKTK